MKLQYIIFLLLLSVIAVSIHSQTSTQNYIRIRTYTNKEGTNYLDKINYFDGLSNPVQVVQRGITPTGQDLINLQEYDNLGRKDKVWLPVVKSSNGAYANPTTIKNDIVNMVEYNKDVAPYSKIVYEASPLNRILEEYGPGADWHNNKKALTTGYKTNISGNNNLNCVLYQVGGTNDNPTLIKSGNYDTGQLSVTEVKDENGNTSFEFKNKLGQVLLTRTIEGTTPFDTYYVYNDLGNLCFVLPPRINDEGITQAKLNELAYIYKYDKLNRCVVKKLPGCEPIFCVYDNTNRLIFTQDGQQRLRNVNEWTVTIPDGSGRIVLVGTIYNTDFYIDDEYESGGPYYSLSSENIVECVSKGEVAFYAEFTNNPDNYGYSFEVRPCVALDYSPTMVCILSWSVPEYLKVNYYDSYAYRTRSGFSGTNMAYANTGIEALYLTRYGNDPDVHSHKGLLTGTLENQIGGSSVPLYTCLYYDDYGRLIQNKSTNHLGGTEAEYIAYNFTGQPTQRKHVHQVTGKNTQTEVYAYTYDHAGRLLKTTHQLTDGTTVKPQMTLAENAYDELGRLKTNKKGGQANLNTTYAYNLRSWTSGINNAHFNEILAYTYNGNISSMQWGQAGKTRKYNFTYDNLSRLITATYIGDGSFNTTYSYDKHGNMLTLQRYGLTAASTYGQIDNLTMTYTGNQMKTAKDVVADIALNTSMDFKDYSTAATEYIYNKNGAMTQDLNKGISSIIYNNLNLPQTVDIKNKTAEGRNEYTYSVSGQKLKAVQRWNPNYSTSPIIGSTVNTATLTQSQTTDYVGNKIYENNVLKRILVDGGYYEGGNYYFYIKDHLGNNRIVANAAASVVQSTQYYPFGTSFADVTGTSTQPYKYNGKELDTRNGLNMYDYSARWKADWYFPTVDPLAENYYSISPYAYCGNNPIRRIDPTGMYYGDYYAMDGAYLFEDGINDNKVYALKNNTYRFYQEDGRSMIKYAISGVIDLTEKYGITHSEFQQIAARIYNETGDLSEKDQKQLASAIKNRKDQPDLGSETWQKTVDRTAHWTDTHERRMSSERRNPPIGAIEPGTNNVLISNIKEEKYQDYINLSPSKINSISGMKSSTAAAIYIFTGGKDLVNGAYQWRGRGTYNVFYKRTLGDTKY
ncbi:MAG: DUF6443 domain-containing protein [Dysgonomonas sp.]